MTLPIKSVMIRLEQDMRAKLHEGASALGRDDGAAYVVAKASAAQPRL
jgi:hypothetical protein